MALITFISDFGNSDHYVAAIKAKIHQLNPNVKVTDISHVIEPFNIAHGAFVLKSVFREFGIGTVHLVAVNSSFKIPSEFIVTKLEGHYFVGPNNGILSLISDKEPDSTILLPASKDSNVFHEKEILASASVKLADGESPDQLGGPFDQMVKMINKKSRASKQRISGSVIHINHYGNLVTNIEKNDFEILSKGKKFRISYGRAYGDEIHEGYSSVVHGESFHLFNDLGLLEIGINMGNGSELLGLSYDSPVNIIFEDQ